jgi:GrpB-like predicted nucleotidyltransferase (UPF0157 family)
LQSSESQLEIVVYDPNWPAAFDAEANRVRSALGPLALRIDHNGSTSVPGLGAKPIIDIQVSVVSLEPLAEYEARLGALGYGTFLIPMTHSVLSSIALASGRTVIIFI